MLYRNLAPRFNISGQGYSSWVTGDNKTVHEFTMDYDGSEMWMVQNHYTNNYDPELTQRFPASYYGALQLSDTYLNTNIELLASIQDSLWIIEAVGSANSDLSYPGKEFAERAVFNYFLGNARTFTVPGLADAYLANYAGSPNGIITLTKQITWDDTESHDKYIEVFCVFNEKKKHEDFRPNILTLRTRNQLGIQYSPGVVISENKIYVTSKTKTIDKSIFTWNEGTLSNTNSPLEAVSLAMKLTETNNKLQRKYIHMQGKTFKVGGTHKKQNAPLKFYLQIFKSLTDATTNEKYPVGLDERKLKHLTFDNKNNKDYEVFHFDPLKPFLDDYDKKIITVQSSPFADSQGHIDYYRKTAQDNCPFVYKNTRFDYAQDSTVEQNQIPFYRKNIYYNNSRMSYSNIIYVICNSTDQKIKINAKKGDGTPIFINNNSYDIDHHKITTKTMEFHQDETYNDGFDRSLFPFIHEVVETKSKTTHQFEKFFFGSYYDSVNDVYDELFSRQKKCSFSCAGNIISDISLCTDFLC